jgi:glutaminyl-peptide cyclotransferase
MFVSMCLIVAPMLQGAAPAAAPSLHVTYNSQQAYAYTAEIAALGERWPGSPGHKKTEDIIHQVLQKDGAQIQADDFVAKTPRGPVNVHNIIGKFNVTANPKQEIFILAGHYDTLFKPGFIGANDGASSTAILLAFADALAHQKTKMQVWLVWTDLEESVAGGFNGDDGLYGSRHIANGLKASGITPRIRGFFLLDMIGDKDLGVARETNSSSHLQEFISEAANDLGYSRYFFQYQANITDDQISFVNVGVPSVDVVDAEFGPMPGADGMGDFHHTNADTMDKVSEHSLEIVGKTVLLAVELIDARE